MTTPVPVSTSTPTSTPQNIDPKKRTPPSRENNPPKKLNLSDSSMEPEETTSAATPTPLLSNNGDSIEKQLATMEQRITAAVTASISTLIADKLRPIEENIRNLTVTKQTINTHSTAINKLMKENQTLQKKITESKEENRELRRRLNKLEDKLMDNNVVIMGVAEEAWELETNLQEKVYQLIAYTVNAQDTDLQLTKARNARIYDVKRLGKYSKLRGRPISVTFERKSEARYFMENKSYLPEGISVRKEYCPETETERRLLRPVLNAAKKHPDFKGKCRMEGPSLCIKGKNYTSSNIHELPEEINGFKSTSRTNNDVFGFFGELNPFSNFHHSQFILNEVQYHSTEQYIQHTKALHYGDKAISQKILQAKTPILCKELSYDINLASTSSERWSKVAKELCYPGIKAKFQQNPELMTLLLSTGRKTLVESSYDKLWGTGCPIHKPNCLDKKEWTSIGILGEILMDIRDKFDIQNTAITSNNIGTLV